MSPIAFFFSASSTNTHCQPCELEPVGACSASSRQSISTWCGTGLSKSRRLRTERVVVRTSSTDRLRVMVGDYRRIARLLLAPGVDDADGLSLCRESELHDAASACRVACFTVAAMAQRKSRDCDPTAREMRPNRSATTVTAPLAFWTCPRISSAGAVFASLRCRAQTPGVQST